MNKATQRFTNHRGVFPVLKAYISMCSLSMDMIDVLDSNGDLTGEVLSRQDVHRLGKLHRAVHLYLFNKENKLLLQRRSAFADHYPSMLCLVYL